MKTLRTIIFTGATLFALALAACGGEAGAASDTLTMSASTFEGTTSVTIKAGQSVKFVDLADGATHLLATGQNGAFAAENGAPTQLESATGMQVAPGQTVSLSFPTAGTYHITCTVHPGMNATVTVTQ